MTDGHVSPNESGLSTSHELAEDGSSHPGQPSQGASAPPSGIVLHMGLAEQGKLHALAGQYDLAMVYYREAMRMASHQGAPELFFRHYLECTLEALEQLGSYREVLSYCDRALAHHETLTPRDDDHLRFLLLDQAYIHQRRGVVLLKMGEDTAARDALTTAIAVGRKGNLRLALAESVQGWLVRRYKVDVKRIEAEQAIHNYYSVRKDTVDPAKAIGIPADHLRALKAI